MKKKLFTLTILACLCHGLHAQDCSPETPPYAIGFETATPPELAACTTVFNVGFGNSWQTAANPGADFSGNVLAYTAATENADTWFFSKGIQLEAGSFYNISYKYGNDGATVENLAVYLSTEVNESTATIQVGTHEGITGGAAVAYSTPGPVSVTESGVYYIAVHAYSSANQGSLYIDDISVDNWGCVTPTGLSVNDITTTGATLGWTAVTTGNTVQFYQISVQPGTGTPQEGPTTTTTSAPTYYDLTPATTYTAYVRSFCSGTWSDWTEGVTFTTPICDTPATVPYTQDFELATVPEIPECNLAIAGETGSNWVTAASPGNGFTDNALAYTGNNEAADSWFFTQGIQLEAGNYYQISYTYGNNGASTESFSSYIATAPTAAFATAAVNTHTGVTGGEAVDFLYPNAVSVPESGVYYIAFHIDSEAGEGSLYLDNISVTEWSCGEPGEITVTDITTTGATISWTAPEGSTPFGYLYAISTSETVTDDQFSMATGVSITVNNLEPDTTYNFFIKSLCGPVVGALAETVTFTTEAAAGVADYRFNNLSVYPNPAKNTLSISNNTTINTGILYTITGQEVANLKINDTTADLNVEKLPAGVYLLTLNSEGAVKTLKVIKE